MLNRIIQFSLNNRLLTLFIGLIFSGLGLYLVMDMDVDVFPDLNAPTVVIMTEAHGMAPEEVERLITFPIETAVNGASNVRRVRSSSSVGFSIVWVEFDWDISVLDARQIVSEKLLTVADDFPEGVGSPMLAPQSSLLGEVMILSLTADRTDPMELRTIADWVIRTRLLSVGGVAQVTVIGGDLKQYQILADPHKMKFYDVSMNKLIETVSGSNQNVPGGFYNEFGNEYIIRGMARTNDVEEIGNNVIKNHSGFPIKVADVAEVKIAPAQKIGDASYRGQKAVVLTVTKQPDINTIKLTQKLNAELENIKKKLPEDVHINTDIFEQASFIKTSINNINEALIEGGILVVFILFIFLMNFRSTFISAIAIPISLLVTTIVLKALGLTLNTMSLGGMAIAIGSIVDDAIIDVENVYKRLNENFKKPLGERRNYIRVIFNASKEIRASILNATLIIIVAFVPLFFLTGMEGRMLQPIGIAYIVSLLASLIVAITLTPVLCSFLLTDEKFLEKQKRDGWLLRTMKTAYNYTLNKSLANKKKILAGTGIVLIGSLILFFSFGRNFLPSFNEGSLAINIACAPGISLKESDKIGRETELALLTIPEVKTTSRKTGRAELAEHSFGVNVSEIEVPFELKDRHRSEFVKEARDKLSHIPGIIFSIGQPISHRIDHLVSGSATNVAIKLFGSDVAAMYSIAHQIKSNISGVEGLVDLRVEQQVEIPQIQIKPKREILARMGISLPEFLKFIDYAFAGEKIDEVFEEEKSFDMVVRYRESERNSIEAIKNTIFTTSNGEKVPLDYIAKINSSFGANTIKRENVHRMLLISANVADRDVRSAVNDIKKIVNEKIKLPESYYVQYSGQFESEEKASAILSLTSLAAILVIFLLLYQEFGNLKIASIILINLPLALIGGVIIVALTSNIISIPSIIGFITLFGIATRNGILLVSRYRALSKTDMELKEIVIQGALDRLSPILMTALTAALALIPLALSGEKPGNEIQSPMAQVILGGLISSTILNLIIVPMVYYIMNSKKQLKFKTDRLK